MTLFKKVFDSHFTDEVDALEHAEAANPSTDLSSAEDRAPSFEEAVERHAEVIQQSEPFSAFAPQSEMLPTTLEPAPEPTVEPSMAERAAQAHAAMRQPREQMTSAPIEPNNSDVAMADQSNVTTPILPPTEDPEPAQMSPPVPEPCGRGRVKTRLLGFHHGTDAKADPFEKAREQGVPPAGVFPTGWLVVIEGPGTGHALAVYGGVSTLGRGDNQAIKLDFGDTSISRQNHAAIAYDGEQNNFFLGHGGKSNIIRLNNKPVLSTEELNHADILRIGETTLRFVALCGADFKWSGPDHDGA